MRRRLIHFHKEGLEADLKPASCWIDLSARVYEDMMSKVNQSRKDVILTFICDFAEEDSLKPVVLLEGLVKQILLKLTYELTPDSKLEGLEYLLFFRKTLEIEELGEMFLNLCRLFTSVTIILDGIDECEITARNDILKWVMGILSFRDTPIKLYVSSRKDVDIKDKLSAHKSIDISKHVQSSDLSLYIRHQVETLKINKDLVLEDPSLYERLIEQLSQKADGM